MAIERPAALALLVAGGVVGVSSVWLWHEANAEVSAPRSRPVVAPSIQRRAEPRETSPSPPDGRTPVDDDDDDVRARAPDEAIDRVAPHDAGTPAHQSPAASLPPGSFAASAQLIGGWVRLGCDGSHCASSGLQSSEVELSPYSLDRDEVTLAEYSACVASGACKPASCNGDPPPSPTASCIDWYDAVAYCQQRGGRLPTEAEWEAAARLPDGRRFPWGDDPRECAGGSQYDVTPSGIHDLAGDVAEWTQDYAGDTPPKGFDPKGPRTGKGRVIRGGDGCARGDDADLRRRRDLSRVVREPWLGFRCAWSKPSE